MKVAPVDSNPQSPSMSPRSGDAHKQLTEALTLSNALPQQAWVSSKKLDEHRLHSVDSVTDVPPSLVSATSAFSGASSPHGAALPSRTLISAASTALPTPMQANLTLGLPATSSIQAWRESHSAHEAPPLAEEPTPHSPAKTRPARTGAADAAEGGDAAIGRCCGCTPRARCRACLIDSGLPAMSCLCWTGLFAFCLWLLTVGLRHLSWTIDPDAAMDLAAMDPESCGPPLPIWLIVTALLPLPLFFGLAHLALAHPGCSLCSRAALSMVDRADDCCDERCACDCDLTLRLLTCSVSRHCLLCTAVFAVASLVWLIVGTIWLAPAIANHPSSLIRDCSDEVFCATLAALVLGWLLLAAAIIGGPLALRGRRWAAAQKRRMQTERRRSSAHSQRSQMHAQLTSLAQLNLDRERERLGRKASSASQHAGGPLPSQQ